MLTETHFDSPNVDMKAVDGPAFVNMNPPKSSRTFCDYCKELKQKASNIAYDVQRLDLVFNIYLPNSLKIQMRDIKGIGIWVSVRKYTPLLKNFNVFERNDVNKTELFQMLVETFISIAQPIIVATSLGHILTNSLADISRIYPCNHEEADTRHIIHVLDGSNNGHKIIFNCYNGHWCGSDLFVPLLLT